MQECENCKWFEESWWGPHCKHCTGEHSEWKDIDDDSFEGDEIEVDVIVDKDKIIDKYKNVESEE